MFFKTFHTPTTQSFSKNVFQNILTSFISINKDINVRVKEAIAEK